MNIKRSSKHFSMTMFSRCVLTLLIMGLCQMAATASPSLRKFPGTASVGNVKAAPSKKKVRSRANAQSDNGISGYMMCANIDEDTYNQYGGVRLGQYHTWFWTSPASKSFEADRTVLTYNTSDGEPYFYFRVMEGGAPLEAIKLILDKSRINDASIACLYYDFSSESGGFYYTDTNVTTDYEKGFVYWKPESGYNLDNIFFYVESGELNIIGFEIYTEGNTPADFFSSGSPFDKVAPPVFKPELREFTDPVSVEISAAEGCTIYYTTDGSTPQVDDKCKYNGPVVISATTTFLAFAVDGEGNRSRTVEAKYTCTRHGIGEDYNPESPGNPGEEGGTVEKTYHLSVVANPTGAGSIYNNNGEYEPGDRVYLSAYPSRGFVFQNWTIDGAVVSTESYFNYVMPEYDVAVVANFIFDPASPGNPSPEDQRVSHPVVVRAIPSGAASLSPSESFTMEENTTRSVYAYPRIGWKLTGWTVNGEKQPGASSYLDITMGEKALDIAAYFTFDPDSPSNPAANYFNPSTGQMIIDDFTAGNLQQAVRALVGDDGYSTISSLIVKGRVANNDYGVVNLLGNASIVDFSRTAGVSDIPSYAFEGCNASSILLPADITSIGYNAFYGCQNLSSLTVYAQVPPECSYGAFNGFSNKTNCTVYVPASAIELYSNADGWKDFLIMPIANDAHVLQVNLPADAADGRYKNNTLEVVNINSGLRQKYVITDRMIYTFNGLQKDEQYNIYMFSQAGLEIGRIENVMIPDGDIEVTFDNLKALHTVYAKVLDGEGRDVTSQVTVEWYKPLADETLTYLRKAVSLGEVPEGQQLLCRVGLDNNLGVVYSTPGDVIYTVGASDNVCTVSLEPLRSVELTGIVVDGDGAAISGASVSATQTLGGKFTKTFTAKTDRNGLWKLSVLDAPDTQLTYSASECVNLVETLGTFDAGVTTMDLGCKSLRSIVGARVSYGFTYREAGSEDVETPYSDYKNVLISVYNVTQKRAHNELSLQYPTLVVLDENINTGDELKLTATSKLGAFNPIEKSVTVGDDNRCEVTFDVVGKGCITASFGMTDNRAVIAMLYSASGQLVTKMDYTESKAVFPGLDDGDYTLVSMGQSDLMSSILRLSNFDEIGLRAGKDYVKSSVKVESGRLTEVNLPVVPAFDESLFYYTTSSTGFTANKSSITTGNYLTLRSVIDFKNVYKNDISNVALIVDLPESCDFVEQSVIQGPNQLPYTLDGKRLTIQLGDNYKSQTRFCVIPTTGGHFNATASVVFNYNDRTITQPIGTAVSVIKNLEFHAPGVIAGLTFKASGVSNGYSKVNIYEGDVLIGSGKANAVGSWTVDCELPRANNLSVHPIFAEITTPENNVLISETKTISYDKNALQVSKVTMYHHNPEFNVTYKSVFDFLNPKTEPTQWTVYYPDKKFTYTIEFTDNDPARISNVILYVHTADGHFVPVNAYYDGGKGFWYAEIDMGHDSNGYYPVNCSVDYDYNSRSLCEFPDPTDDVEAVKAAFQSIADQFDNIETYEAKGTSLSDADKDGFDATYGLAGISYDDDFLPADFDNWTAEEQDAFVDNYFKQNQDSFDADAELFNTIIAAFSSENTSTGPVVFEDGSSIVTETCDGLTEALLLERGYEKIDMLDNSVVYVLTSDEMCAIADFTNNKHIISTVPVDAVRKIGGMMEAPAFISNIIHTIRELGDKARNWSENSPIVAALNFINTVSGKIDEGFKSINKGFQDIIDKSEANWLKQSGEYGRYKSLGKRCKNPAKRLLYQGMALKAQAKAGKLFLVFKGTKFVLGTALKAIPIADWLFILGEAYAKGTDVYDMFQYLDKVKICKEEHKSVIESYRSDLRWLTAEVVSYEVGTIALNVVGDLTIAGGIAAALETAGISLAPSVISFLIKTAGNIGYMLYNDRYLDPKISTTKAKIMGLKFNCSPEPEPDPAPGPGNGGGYWISGSVNDVVEIDPSGFVYEAVPANRVEGVQASIYYKETKEDMYGDPYEEVILWNAEEYAQRNPLFTDENGMYRWDVPQGLWQVKFEKDGYLTAYSDWLPVPPPQLEVNIPIVQNKQPEVTEARAYEEGIEVQFDKFMDPSTLNTSNIFVTANGEKLTGEIRLIDSAVADANADPEDTSAPQFASRVRFVPEQKLSTTTGEIRLTVSRNVLSYAGIPMTETFSQALDVEKEVQAIAADDVKVLYGGEKEVTVYALPFDAAVGRKLRVATSSDMIATVDVTEVTLDAEGKAVLKVRGALPGRAQLSFAIDDVTVTGDCAVDVVTEIITAEAPKSSRASGTAVYRGTKIELTTDSKNATIYFTTDGSCPCDENGTRRKYTVPIVINDDTHIIAMTSVGNGDDDISETVEFNYTLKRSDMDFQMPEGWTWMSHNFETALTPDAIAGDANVSRILSQTQEVIRDPQLGMVGTLRELSASESYKVQTSSATSRVRLSDVAWNPATPIALTSGWNWLGYPLSQTMSVDEAFADTQAETLDIVVGQNGFAQFDGTNWVGTLETMSPGMGYMYQSQTGNNVVYNTSIVSTAASKYQPGIADNSPLVLDIHKYGKIMPVIATVSDLGRQGLSNDDCQVAAFCGSECRGIGRIVNGLVMMNVYGDTDDNITFTVTDLEGETAYANTASLRFGETVVGNVFSPYVIAINSGQDGISAVTYGGDITVSVEGDMLRINGIDARDIDFVEVYDMSARKLMRETNISASGVRISNLSADVYVVVVCGNGEYTYHKIAVR